MVDVFESITFRFEPQARVWCCRRPHSRFCGDSVHACRGGFMAASAQQVGLAGVVIDGAVTDPAEIRECGVAVWSRSISPTTTRFGGSTRELNVPITCGGAAVSPGDGIVADESGIMVLAPDPAAAIATQALAMQEEERELLQELKRGKTAPDITGAIRDYQRALNRAPSSSSSTGSVD